MHTSNDRPRIRNGVTGTVTRRSFLNTAAILGTAVAAGPLVTGCASKSASSPSKRSLRVRSPGGQRQAAMEKHVWPQFTKETGIEIEPVAVNVAKLLAGSKAGNAELDLVESGAIGLETLRGAEALEKIDIEKLKRTNPDDLFDYTDYWIGADVSAEVLAYNTKKFPSAGPTSWADFWDVSAWKGQRSLMDATAEHAPLEIALLADGVALEDIYPLDMDRAFDKLKEIKPHILKFWTSAAESEQLASSGQADLIQMWHGRAVALARDGAEIQSVINQASLQPVGLAIAKGSQMVDEAMTYIDYFCQPKVQARFVSTFPNSPGNKQAHKHIKSKKLLELLPTSEQNIDKAFRTDYKWWATNQGRMQNRWQQFLLG